MSLSLAPGRRGLAAVACAAVAASLVLLACDQLNKPIGSASSSSSGGTWAVPNDAGSDGSDEHAAPAPTISAQPGDLHL